MISTTYATKPWPRMYAACTPRVRRMRPACTPRVPRVYAACAPRVRRVQPSYVPHARRMCAEVACLFATSWGTPVDFRRIMGATRGGNIPLVSQGHGITSMGTFRRAMGPRSTRASTV